MSQTQVILLQRVDSLGELGEVVNVKPGYARNYLLPQKKALRATKANVAYFEAQKSALLAENDKRKSTAEKLAKKLEGAKLPLIRQASEAGQLFGSVSARDIAEEATKIAGETIDRSMIHLNQNFKFIGLFPVEIFVHPEVKVEVTINIARTKEEAEIQAETGKALITDDSQLSEEEKEEIGGDIMDKTDQDALKEALEDGALEAEVERLAEEEEQAKLKAEKAAAREAERQAKAEAEAAAAEAAGEPEEGEAVTEQSSEEEAEEKA